MLECIKEISDKELDRILGIDKVKTFVSSVLKESDLENTITREESVRAKYDEEGTMRVRRSS